MILDVVEHYFSNDNTDIIDRVSEFLPHNTLVKIYLYDIIGSLTYNSFRCQSTNIFDFIENIKTKTHKYQISIEHETYPYNGKKVCYEGSNIYDIYTIIESIYDRDETK